MLLGDDKPLILHWVAGNLEHIPKGHMTQPKWGANTLQGAIAHTLTNPFTPDKQ